MKKECFDSGSCVKCGCKTTALQMCNKKCDGNCYPPMMSKDDWASFTSYRFFQYAGFELSYQLRHYNPYAKEHYKRIPARNQHIKADRMVLKYKGKIKHTVKL